MNANTNMQILNVPIEDIIPNRFQPRLNFDESSLQELASSIKEHGIIQPLVLRRLGDKYEIIAGERRYKASKIAGLTTVPAIISEMDDKKSAEVAIVENVQRKDLSAIEEAKSYKSLLDKGYLTQEELAKKMGLSQSAISNKLRLLSLSENVQNALMEGKISERHARSLLQVDSFEEQDKWLDTIINERLTVRALDKRLRENLPNKATDSVEKKDNNMNNDITSVINNFNNSDQSMPNKFFNFLEDEQINMSTSEDTRPEIIETIQEVPMQEESTQNEEIEMLDFLAPADVQTTSSLIKETEPIDMTLANSKIDLLINELKENNYKIEVVKEESTENLKFVITIKK